MNGLVDWILKERPVDRHGFGWRQWVLQAVIVLCVLALMAAYAVAV